MPLVSITMSANNVPIAIKEQFLQQQQQNKQTKQKTKNKNKQTEKKNQTNKNKLGVENIIAAVITPLRTRGLI